MIVVRQAKSPALADGVIVKLDAYVQIVEGNSVGAIFALADDNIRVGIRDECDITLGLSQDCNANGVPDECDFATGTSLDCNLNGIPDGCDLASSPDQRLEQSESSRAHRSLG